MVFIKYLKHILIISLNNVKVKKGSYFFGRVNIDNRVSVRVGENTKINNIEIVGQGDLIIGDSVQINDLFVHLGDGARIHIGDDVFIGKDCKLIIYSGLSIGSGTLVAPEVLVVDNDHVVSDTKIKDSGLIKEKVKLGDNCWVGAKSTITKGASLPNDSVVGAMSLYNLRNQSSGMFAGIPTIKKKNYGKNHK
ncbi:DapH/DapD/GlmU-related protein [Vibrio splendidus]|uniref:DapH/DapD/GlmU-related protein n=1 Tax=Vibrio splendidus TaxID=29497 RepID=UPI000C8446C6|nr:DapH/DapD/GlmU-related protein [Vibrio splendidus]PMI31373.1 hypothetical protein BCU48_00010 [Vibrio splendidus]